ncbi:MAG: hypothetical protein HZC42_10390, partial [Candidatus Eisenbacteria bacterium]|nr:hypothetical protein [Candidatus Eisenbacteria bacterium]
MRRLIAAVTLAAAVTCPLASPVHAAWPHDPGVNLIAVPGEPHSQYLYGGPECVSDGAEGIIIVMDVWIGSGNDDLAAQRIGPDGTRVWGTAGVPGVTATGNQYFHASASDGQGGVIFAWPDDRGGTKDIYAQRLDANGTALWGAGGVAVSQASGDQTAPRLARDGSGGAWIVWTDGRNGAANTDIYCRRVNAAGVPQSTADGVAVCAATGNQSTPRIAMDGLLGAGAIMTWRDERTDGGDIYAQRILNTSVVSWAANGVVVCNAASTQQVPAMCSDGGTGVIVVWNDNRSGADLYAQRVWSSGTVAWTANGVPVCSAINQQSQPQIIQDGRGGVIAVFNDYRNGGSDIYAQRFAIDSGTMMWGADGVPVCTELGTQTAPQLASDRLGGASVVWTDYRQNDYGDVYVQRLDGNGTRLWTTSGVPVGTGSNWEYGPNVVSSGPGECLVAFTRDPDAVVQKVDRWGYLGAEPVMADVADVANDQGGQVKVSWLASPLDTDVLFENISDYLVFRSAPASLVAAALAAGRVTTSADEVAAAPAGARRLLRTTTPAGAAAYWELVASQQAYHLPSYSVVAPTTGDSVAGSNPLTSFMVQARNYYGGYWNSAPDSGYSVDDLAPVAPAPFSGTYANGTAQLQWGANAEADLAGYRLYRGLPGFTPAPGNRVAELATTSYVDAAGQPWTYKLTAVDVHGNESAATALTPLGTVDAGDGPPAVDFLAPPMPNP